MTTTEAIKQLQIEHDLIAHERDLDGSQFAPALLEALAMAIEALKCSEIPNYSEPKCADGCIYGWGSSECGHCDYRSEEPKTGDTISRKAAVDAAIKADIENHGGVLSEKRARIIDKRISAMPPAQPEIIRCKDCGHWDTTWQNDFAPNYHYCSLVDGTRRGDFFCADAERRGEQDGNQ